MLQISSRERKMRYQSRICRTTSGMMSMNALVIKAAEILVALVMPNTLIRVCVPAVWSAEASRMSLVEVPPMRKSAAMVPIIRGN